MGARRTEHLLVKSIGWTLVAAIALPIIVLIGVSLNAGIEQVFPPRGLSLRWYTGILERQRFLDAAKLTLLLAIGSSIVSVTLATLAGLAIVRGRFVGRDLILTFLLSPLIVPQVVVGMAFLVTLSAMGIFSSLISLAVLHCVITLPFGARVIVSALGQAPIALEEAAQSLGAPPAVAFLKVTLPVIRPGVVAGGIFSFVTSFENFTASQFLVWDRTTLPVEIYTFVQTESDPTAAAISSLIVLTVIAFVIVFNRFVSRYMFAGR